jgi:hypothetical protein
MVKSLEGLKDFPAFERLNIRPVKFNADPTQIITTGDLAVKCTGESAMRLRRGLSAPGLRFSRQVEVEVSNATQT